MSLPRHLEYKDSGVAWLGEVPKHWSINRYKAVFTEREERSVDGTETLLSVSAYTGVSPRSEIIGEGDHLSRAESLEGYKVCYPNDLVMNIMLAWNRGLGFSQQKGIVSPAYSVFKLSKDDNPKFLDYLVRDERTTLYFKAFSAGVIESRLRLYPDVFGALYCALPPKPEQTAIATFLDRETAKIDALIAEQEKLLTLLAEKRQATISHAVTKGLNPDAPMKDSGVAWLGEVPAHWECQKLSLLTEKIGDGLHGTPNYVDDSEYFFINGNNLVDGSIVFTPNTRNVSQQEVLSQSIALSNKSVLISINGTIGNVALYNDEKVMLGKSAAYVNCSDRLDRRYLAYFLQSDSCGAYFYNSLTGTTIHNLSLETIRATRVPLPSLGEQRNIIDFLNGELAKLHSLEVESERAIDLLKERRTALISAAVTGKIDVRHLANQEAA